MTTRATRLSRPGRWLGTITILAAIGSGLLAGIGGGWLPTSALAPVALAYLAAITASYLVLILDDVVFSTYRRTRDRVLLAGHVLFEQFIFRPLTAIWRLWGLRLFLQGRTEWGAQQRRGFTPQTSPAGS